MFTSPLSDAVCKAVYKMVREECSDEELFRKKGLDWTDLAVGLLLTQENLSLVL